MSLSPEKAEVAVISVAPTGARRGRQDHSAIPLTAEEIAAEALRCAEAGASLLHLHVRDRNGVHTLDVGIYQEVMRSVRRAVGDRLVLQVTTEAVGRYLPDEQMAMVRELKPEAISLVLREILPNESVDSKVVDFFAWLDQECIGVQYILFSSQELERFIQLHKRGIIHGERRNVLFVLGQYGVNRPSEPSELIPFFQALPKDWVWTVCAFGRTEARCASLALALGGHVRVGFENNLHLPNGTLAPSNDALVSHVRNVNELIGRPLASVAETRALFVGR